MTLQRQVRAVPGAEVIRTVCPYGCGITCGILAHVKDGVLVKVEPSDHADTGHVCIKSLSAPKLVYHPDRLKHPMKRVGERGDGKWQQISWEEAFETIASKLKAIGAKYGSNSLGFVSTGVGLFSNLLTVGFAGACGGTFILPAGLGDSAGPCADQVSFGAFMWFGEDYPNRFENPAFCVAWGNNPADTQPFKWRRITEAKEKGARLVVIDPRFTTTAAKADEYIQIRPGTDAALALGMMNVILERGLQDTAFLTEHTVAPFLVRSDNGLFLREKDISGGESEKYLVWDQDKNNATAHDTPTSSPPLTGTFTVNGIECRPAFQLLSELIHQYPPEKASEITNVPVETITKLAMEYATQKPTATYRGMGGTRGSLYGDLTFRAINTLAAITGNLSVRTPHTTQYNFITFMTHGISDLVTLLQMYEAIENEQPHPIKSLWMTRHNLMNQDPNFNKFTQELLPKLELVVAVDMFMTTSAQYADIVLPACSPYESNDLAASIGDGAQDYFQLQKKVIEPLHECKSELQIFSGLAEKMGIEGFLDKTDEEFIGIMIDSGHPTMEGITLEKLKESPQYPAPDTAPPFATPSGRIEFYTERLIDFDQALPVYIEPMESHRTPLAQKYPLSISTTHPKYRLHSMHTNISWIREIDIEPVLNISPEDALSRNIKDGDTVRAFNDRGEVKLKAQTQNGIQPGLVNMNQGWSPWHFKKGTHQALTHNTINPAQAAVYEPNAAFCDTLVEVERVEEG